MKKTVKTLTLTIDIGTVNKIEAIKRVDSSFNLSKYLRECIWDFNLCSYKKKMDEAKDSILLDNLDRLCKKYNVKMDRLKSVLKEIN